ncbi:hypothetical protein K437DRAFT_276856 [Tilletiaria anomala UBC 951]|uniref:Uncharacterized protein n=1 Tax=Tilletiaria anomala (strain ATCC 24038 / CBS 436.72 / UBC 951) TaxID=1037660 RepID=A0A066VBR5_TILAU|nr:uncharacterized protein K437DRAFT_276856 [Tilletiaria anomala UBC 951]KDN36204.1 hypothetical protein K437DRAFT_276856 [Tilletiaria anomala UBC 951]
MVPVHPRMAQALTMPLYLQPLMPTGLQAVDLEFIFGLHVVLSMVAVTSMIHPRYTLSLAILGLIVTSEPLLPSNNSRGASLLVVFTLIWFLSVPLDIFWFLSYRYATDSIAVFTLCANMCFKVVSLVSCSSLLVQLGLVDESTAAGTSTGAGDRGDSGLSSSSHPQVWNRSAGSSSGGVGNSFGRSAEQARDGPPTGNIPGGYRDDDAQAQEESVVFVGEEDAIPVSSTTTLFDSTAAGGPTPPSLANSAPKQSQQHPAGYHTLE